MSGDPDPARPRGVDHLIYGAASLEEGMDRLESLLGVRPVLGGRHAQFGTRNALLSLGPGTYVEVLAPDPDLPEPPGGRLFALERLREPRLVTWVLSCASIVDLHARATEADVPLGEVRHGGRDNPDGTRLTWRVTDPYAVPLEGAVPFVIDWGATPHPSGVAPVAGSLASLRIEHPRAQAVRRALETLGADLPVVEAEPVRLVAGLRTPAGEVELS